MEELFERYPTREAFDAYWNENYKPLTYADVKEAYEAYVKDAGRKIFISDYQENHAICRDDFMENLSQDAQFFFQDTLTEVFYERNPEVYETAFALYEAAEMSGQKERDVAQSFHEEYHRLYHTFLLQMFEELFTWQH